MEEKASLTAHKLQHPEGLQKPFLAPWRGLRAAKAALEAAYLMAACGEAARFSDPLSLDGHR